MNSRANSFNQGFRSLSRHKKTTEPGEKEFHALVIKQLAFFAFGTGFVNGSDDEARLMLRKSQNTCEIR
jgi:hypothetical protein